MRATSVASVAGGRVEYRLERRGPQAVLMLHGGHMRADLPLGEEVFAGEGYTTLAVSRPGYGRTPLTTGTSPDGFADIVARLCADLGLGPLAAVVGQSAGGPTAVALAARHHELVERLILQSAVGLVPWPDRRTRIGAAAAFHPRTEAVTWGLIRAMTRHAPGTALRLLLPDLTARPVADLLASLTDAQRGMLLDLFGRMRSGAGFRNDVRATSTPRAIDRLAAVAARVRRPTLVIASRDDGSVSYDHARSLAETIAPARLVTSTAPSHMIWLGDDYPAIAAAIADFLRSGVDPPEAPPAMGP
ncbi:alpha/beta hydrolase [Mycobacterium tuberculosis]|nr:alpha/beta hydrolase [Mycobacterium tuberculosis]